MGKRVVGILAVLPFLLLGLSLAAAEGGYADVVKAVVRPEGGGRFSFDVTIKSPDTGWKKYANAFQIRTPEGKVLGTRTLYHPHVNEQPFARSLNGVRIPTGVAEVVVYARDSVAGWGGKIMRLRIPGR